LYLIFLQQRKIRIIGGKSAENYPLTNELAKCLTWDGQRKTEGIKNTNFANIIIGITVNK